MIAKSQQMQVEYGSKIYSRIPTCDLASHKNGDLAKFLKDKVLILDMSVQKNNEIRE